MAAKSTRYEKRIGEHRRGRVRYSRLAENCAALLERAPRAFAHRLLWLVVAAWASIGLYGLALVAATYALATTSIAAFAILPGLFGLGFLSAVLVIVPRRPPGVLVKRGRLQALWDEVDALSERMDAPRVQYIVIDLSVNAGAAQLPAFGVFGWRRQGLIVGLPLLAGLTTDEVRFLLAHEVAHLSRNHGKTFLRLARTLVALGRLRLSCEGGRWLLWPLATYLKWFNPIYEAATLALCRRMEYEADAAGAAVTNADTAARTLTRMRALTLGVDQPYWMNVTRRTAWSTLPPANVVQHLIAAIREGAPERFRVGAIKAATSVETDPEATHPGLADRVRALGGAVDLVELGMVPVSAMDGYLGSEAEAIIRELQAFWERKIGRSWRKAHVVTEPHLEKQAQLFWANQPEDRVAYAESVAQLRGHEEAVRLLRRLVAEYPDLHLPQTALARMLLNDGFAEGIDVLQTAVQLGARLGRDDHEALKTYHTIAGDHLEAEAADDQEREHRVREAVVLEEALANRLNVRSITGHGLTPERLERLRGEAAKVRGLGWLYAFQVRIEGDEAEPGIALIGIPDRWWAAVRFSPHLTLRSALVKAITLPEVKAVWVPVQARREEKRLKRVPGTLVWSRPPRSGR